MNKELMLGIICDLYEEIGIKEFGFDLEVAIKKLDINLIPYSSFESKKRLLLGFDEDGFNCVNPHTNKVEIYYNDEISPKERIKFTLPHELGHVCLGHNVGSDTETQEQNKEANEFAREFYCPQAFIMHYNLKTASDLVSAFGITYAYANILQEKLRMRCGRELSNEEKRLIEIFENNKKTK